MFEILNPFQVGGKGISKERRYTYLRAHGSFWQIKRILFFGNDRCQCDKIRNYCNYIDYIHYVFEEVKFIWTCKEPAGGAVMSDLLGSVTTNNYLTLNSNVNHIMHIVSIRKNGSVISGTSSSSIFVPLVVVLNT